MFTRFLCLRCVDAFFELRPLKYDKLNVFQDIVATQATRLEIDVPGEDGRSWRRTGSSVDVGQFDEAWREKVNKGVQHLLTETWVPANVASLAFQSRIAILMWICCRRVLLLPEDPHYDAKCFPCAHPYGTGSLLSEPGSGGTQRMARSRLTALDSLFRQSSLWGFWMLDRLIKTALDSAFSSAVHCVAPRSLYSASGQRSFSCLRAFCFAGALLQGTPKAASGPPQRARQRP